MFGHKVPNSSSITVNIKIAIGAGRPPNSVVGSPSTKTQEIVCRSEYQANSAAISR